MKRFFLLLLLVLLCLGGISSCKKAKRCVCVTQRGKEFCRGIVALGSDASCDQKNAEWTASDSTRDILKMTCVPEE